MNYNKIPFTLCSILLVLMMSCSKPSESTEGLLVIKDDMAEDASRFGELVDSIAVLELEATPSSYFEFVDKLKAFGEHLYLFDQARHQILRFDREGRFVDKLQKLGKGHGEYSMLSSFDISHKGEIYLVDPNARKVLVYDMNFEFLREKTFDFYFRGILIDTSNNHILLEKSLLSNQKEYQYHIVEYTQDFELVAKHLPYVHSSSSILVCNTGGGPLQYADGQMVYMPYYSDRSYVFQSGQFVEEYIWDFDKPYLTAENQSQMLDTFLNKIGTKDFVRTLCQTQNRDFLVFQVSDDLDSRNGIYNKVTKELRVFKSDVDPNCRCGEFFTILGFEGDHLLVYVRSSSFGALIDRLDPNRTKILPEQQEVIKRLATNEDNSGNPILLYLKLKSVSTR